MKNLIYSSLILFCLFGLNNLSHAQCDGGSVSESVSDATTVYTCPGDGLADIVNFSNSSSASSDYVYLITDVNNAILAVELGSNHNFESAPPGECRVWGLSYSGTLNANPGDIVTEVVLCEGCFELSDNYISIIRDMPEAGTVNISGSDETMTYTCPGDGNADVVEFAHMTESNSNYTYVITDDMNNILGLPPGNSNDFDGAPAGTCRVWGLSYTGSITAMMGDNIDEVNLSSDCFDLSDNYISIIRDMPDGGTVNISGSDETMTYTCPGDGNADVVEFAHMTESNSNYTYVITDDMNNILGLPPGNSNDFDGAPAGTCRVWGLSYTGSITAIMSDNIDEVNLSSDCFDLSNNYISIIRDMPDGGTVNISGSDETMTYTCPGDGNADVVEFAHMTESNSNYTYVITDDMNNILGLPPGNSNDFDGAPAGTCRVWGLSYTGSITAMMSDNIDEVNLSSDCFDLSNNYISIIREGVDGGMVSELGTGEIMLNTITGDGSPDIIEFDHSTSSEANYIYLITDDMNNILGLPPGNSNDFEGAPAGTCRVWGLSYTGSVIAMAGDNVIEVDLSDRCFELSSNYIEIQRNTPTAILSTSFGDRLDILVYPSPATTQVSINIAGKDLIGKELNVISVHGGLIETILIEDTQFQMDVSQYKSGLYFVKVLGSNTISTGRFIKE